MAKKLHNVPYLVLGFAIFSLRLTFGIKKFQVFFTTFARKIKKLLAELLLFLTNIAVNENIKSERKLFRQSVS